MLYSDQLTRQVNLNRHHVGVNFYKAHCFLSPFQRPSYSSQRNYYGSDSVEHRAQIVLLLKYLLILVFRILNNRNSSRDFSIIITLNL